MNRYGLKRFATSIKRNVLRSGSNKFKVASGRKASSTAQLRNNRSLFDRAENFRFNSAIVRNVSPRISDGLKMDANKQSLNHTETVAQHSHYVQTLRNLGLIVHTLPADDELPDCIFPEDTAVVIGNIALITQPGHPSRRPETEATKRLLAELGHDITEMVLQNSEATLDGGDVLFTGKEIFVGISSRTNMQGFTVLADTFPMYPATPIEIVNGLHLKSPLGLAGLGRITYTSDDECARHSVKQMKEKSKYKYDYLGCPGPFEAGNCIYMSTPTTQKTILYPGPHTSPEGAKVFESIKDHTLIPLKMTETAKIDGSLTCCSILLVT